MPTYSASGINFNRTGVCNRCPLEKIAPCCVGCPHFENVNGVNTCLVYATRDKVCDSCVKLGKFTDQNGTHADCIDWPQHPFLGAIKDKKCAYKFETVNKNDQVKVDEIYSKW